MSYLSSFSLRKLFALCDGYRSISNERAFYSIDYLASIKVDISSIALVIYMVNHEGLEI